MGTIDLSNHFLREAVRGFGARHEERLREIRERLADLADEARRDEAELAAEYEMAPRPLAAVLDIDEVLLCNIHASHHEDFHAADHFLGPDGQPWPRDDDFRLGPALPGALPLLEEFERLGVRTFFVTGRREAIRDETIENFAFVGFDRVVPAAELAGERLVMWPDRREGAKGAAVQQFKEAAREAIARTHRIIVNIGDQPTDLGRHGDEQILLHHPFYYT